MKELPFTPCDMSLNRDRGFLSHNKPSVALNTTHHRTIHLNMQDFTLNFFLLYVHTLRTLHVNNISSNKHFTHSFCIHSLKFAQIKYAVANPLWIVLAFNLYKETISNESLFLYNALNSGIVFASLCMFIFKYSLPTQHSTNQYSSTICC